jgi:hypothetical protein
MNVVLKSILGLLVVAGAATVLLPGLAQQPVPIPGGQRDGINLDKVKQDLQRAADDLARAKDDLDKLTKDYEGKVAALKMAMEQVKKAEQHLQKDPDKGPGVRAGGGFGGGGGGGGFGGGGLGGGPFDKRLADIEKKLDAVMHSVEELHKLMAKRNLTGPVPPPPGGPGYGGSGGPLPPPPAGKGGIGPVPVPPGGPGVTGPGGPGLGSVAPGEGVTGPGAKPPKQ